jgi:Cys-tRNA(Pro) deacylase
MIHVQKKGSSVMSLESVRKYFQDNNLSDLHILETDASTATVELAANAHGVEPALIAKTMAFGLKNKEILIVVKGDARIDNRKFKDCFHEKASMLSYDKVLEITGHPVGGVCPFGLKNPMDIYLDVSMKEFEVVYPAAGSANSAVKISPDRLQEVTGGTWVDVCK